MTAAQLDDLQNEWFAWRWYFSRQIDHDPRYLSPGMRHRAGQRVEEMYRRALGRIAEARKRATGE